MTSTHRTTEPLVAAVAFLDTESLHDGLDRLRELDPTVLEYFDSRLFDVAATQGKKYAFYEDAKEQGDIAGVALVEFHSHSGRHKKKAGKRIAKLFKDNAQTIVAFPGDEYTVEDLQILADIPTVAFAPGAHGDVAPQLLGSVFIPPERFERFTQAVAELEKKHHVTIALFGHASQHLYDARPTFNLSKVGDRQRVFKLLGEWSQLVAAHDGYLTGDSGEGRIKTPFVRKEMDEDIVELHEAIRAIFDPQNIMNTGVKQAVELKSLVSALRTDYDGADFAANAPSN